MKIWFLCECVTTIVTKRLHQICIYIKFYTRTLRRKIWIECVYGLNPFDRFKMTAVLNVLSLMHRETHMHLLKTITPNTTW